MAKPLYLNTKQKFQHALQAPMCDQRTSEDMRSLQVHQTTSEICIFITPVSQIFNFHLCKTKIQLK